MTFQEGNLTRSRVLKQQRGLRAVIYIRVSKEREEMISPETQEHECRKLCEREGYEIVEIVQDLDLSGRSFAKRQIERIIGGMEDDRWDVLVTWKWSRFGRNLTQCLINLERVKEARGWVRAATEDFDAETTMGKFTRDQLLLIAELQSNQIGDGWRDAHSRRRRNGLPHTGERRFGYNYDRHDGFTPHPTEGPALAEAYEKILAGEGFKTVATWLNQRGLKTVPGNNWSASSLAHLLQNGFAAGLVAQGFIKRGEYEQMLPGAHEPLITMETWHTYMASRDRRPAYTRNNKKAYSVSGLVVCGECGGKMRARNTNGGGKNHNETKVGHSFECGRKIDRQACPGCNGSRMSIEAAAVNSLRALLTNREVAVEENLRRAGKSVKVAADIENLEQELAKAKRSRGFLVDLLEDGDIDRNEYRERKARLDESIERLNAEIAANAVVEKRITPQLTPAAQETLQIALERWDELSQEGKRAVLETHVQAVVVYPGRAYTDEQRAEKYRVYLLWEDLPVFPHQPVKLPTRAPRTSAA
jgi:site-specific DNA recombinase